MRDADVVLITDDNPENLRVLSRTLEPEGYVIRAATTGEQAIESMQAAPPDLALLDVQLPGVDGYEVCRWIRSRSEHADIPVIFVSAAADAYHKTLAFEAGGDDYISKPFQGDEVIARVRTHLAAAKYRHHLEDLNIELLQRYESAFEQAAVGISYVEPKDRTLTQVNQRFCDIMGYTRDELIGKPITDLSHPDSLERDREVIEALLAGRIERGTREKQYVRKDGTVIWGRVRISLVQFGKKGAEESLVGVVEDITERKKAEQELERALVEIRDLKERAEAENVYLREEIKLAHLHGDIVGRSEGMTSVLSQAEQVAETDATVLLMGETGTGKELLARAIHEMSTRSDESLVIVNCAAMPDALVESELFGREKGAYTGALTRQIGRFEAAHGGTIFLDEIGELPGETQAKLLRVLQEGEFERLGGSKTISVDVRVVAATNRNLEEEVRKKAFRDDLFFRLNVFPITIPPLRDRPEDIEPLVWSFVEKFSSSMGKKVETIYEASLEALRGYPWPGNVRELRNVVERAMIGARGPTLRIRPPAAPAQVHADMLTMDDLQRQHIRAVLERTAWRVRGEGGAASILGMKPSTLESRMAKLGVKRPRRGS